MRAGPHPWMPRNSSSAAVGRAVTMSGGRAEIEQQSRLTLRLTHQLGDGFLQEIRQLLQGVRTVRGGGPDHPLGVDDEKGRPAVNLPVCGNGAVGPFRTIPP